MTTRFLRLLPILLLVGFATARAAGTHTSQRISAAAALQKAVAASPPGRNLYALADQLVLHPPRPIPHVIRHTNPNYPIGHQDTFYVDSDDQNKYFTLQATIRAKTPHLYIYVQNGLKINDTDVQHAAQVFEKKTYPTDRRAFGSEWTPGVDGDPHVVCLVGDLRTARAAGLFSAEDEYPRLVNPYSNQREMFYINSDNTLPGNGEFDLVLAHEFQHMIHWHMHQHDSLWINEGMSMLAEQLNGYSDPSTYASAFLSQPKTQLNTWDENNDFPHYGAAYLFLSYLHQRFGAKFTRAMLADKQYTDFQLIDDVLRKLHIKSSSRTLFAQWAVANYVADKTPGSRFGYKYLPHAIDADSPKTVPFAITGGIPPYTADYTTLDHLQGAKPFTLHFSAPTTIPVVGVSRLGPFWWSNRGDMMTTSLQRTIDLRSVGRADLDFDAWWQIEKDYDYAYVEVSTDGGKTYTTLKATDTTTENPNAANYGNGFTGFSNGWRKEQVNLFKYAGKVIKLRFQYVTDDGMNYPSMLLQHIRIPAIGWKDNYTGWSTNGFIPLYANALPSNWNVQLVSYTSSGIHVSTLPLNGTMKGSTTIDPAKTGLKKLVVVVFTTAPKTTVNTSYQLSAGG